MIKKIFKGFPKMNRKISMDMKLSIIMLILLLLISLGEDIYNYSTQNGIENLSNKNSLSNQKKNFPVLVAYYESRYGHTKSFEYILKEIQREYKDKMKFEFIDLSLKRNNNDYLNNQIYTLPVLIIYDAQGNEIYRHAGTFLNAKQAIVSIKLAQKF